MMLVRLDRDAPVGWFIECVSCMAETMHVWVWSRALGMLLSCSQHSKLLLVYAYGLERAPSWRATRGKECICFVLEGMDAV